MSPENAGVVVKVTHDLSLQISKAQNRRGNTLSPAGKGQCPSLHDNKHSKDFACLLPERPKDGSGGDGDTGTLGVGF
jgi:hypothetical protein